MQKTIAEMTKRINEDLKEISGLVEAMATEIYTLRRKNDTLRSELKSYAPDQADTELAIAEKAERMRKMTLKEFQKETYYGFSSYLYDALLRGFEDKENTPMETLLSYMPSELDRHFRGIGIRSIKELIGCLKVYGLALAEEKDAKFLKKMAENGII